VDERLDSLCIVRDLDFYDGKNIATMKRALDRRRDGTKMKRVSIFMHDALCSLLFVVQKGYSVPRPAHCLHLPRSGQSKGA